MKLDVLYSLGRLAVLAQSGPDHGSLARLLAAAGSMLASQMIGVKVDDLRMAASMIAFAVPLLRSKLAASPASLIETSEVEPRPALFYAPNPNMFI